MENKPLRFHLRYQILPSSDIEERSEELADFCKAHGVEEVVLFFSAEEWNNGLLSVEDEDIWFDTVKRAKSILDKAGIVTSLNPWMTTLHCDRGRNFPDGKTFRPMVSPEGEVSKACASFACPEWQKYITDQYARFAALGFRIIWVEDDFRFHNHDPLTWGGGFEDEVLDLFSNKIGEMVKREEIVENIVKPGIPHPWRVKWMETWRELQLKVAAMIAESVSRGAGGKTSIGLMSSLPKIHSVEGRSWKKLFKAFSIGGKIAHRPHFAFYTETPGKFLDYSSMMLDVQKQLRPRCCEVAPEIENWPFTSWTKSDTQTWCEMALALFHGSDALFLDLFPHTGMVREDPQIGNLLDKSRPAFEWISEKFSKDLKTTGVGIPWKEDAQAHVQTQPGASITELGSSDFTLPGKLLMPYGIPVSADIQNVNALFGDLAWAFSDEEIHSLLHGGLLLDGDSAHILSRRGFDRYIGVNVESRINRAEENYSIEVVVKKIAGVKQGYYFNANTTDYIYKLEPEKGAEEWTHIITPANEKFGAGIVTFDNELGGRVAVFAYPDPASLPRNFQKQAVMQNLIRFIKSPSSFFVTGGVNLIPVHFQGENKEFAVVLNSIPDPVKPQIKIVDGAFAEPGFLTKAKALKSFKSTLLCPLKEPADIEIDLIQDSEGVTITTRDELPYLGFLILEW